MSAHTGILDSEAGWHEVVRLCHRQARAVLGAGDAVDDVAQEAALRAWRHRRACQDPAHPWPWVASIARREALRAAARPAPAPLDEAPEPVADEHDVDGRLDVRDALAALRPADRALVVERYVVGRTSEEIGTLHDLTPGAVRVRLHRSRMRLRGLLSET